jgi:hypothetical protein
VEPVQPESRLGPPLFGGVAEHRLDLGRHEPPASLRTQVGDVGYGRQALDERAVADLGLVELPFGALALAGVDRHPDIAERLTAPAGDRRGAGVDRDELIAATHAELGLPLPALSFDPP